jgi:hypothetical protein
MKTIQSKNLTIPAKLIDIINIKKTILISSNLNSKQGHYHQNLIISGPLGVQSMLIPSFLNLDLNVSKNFINVSCGGNNNPSPAVGPHGLRPFPFGESGHPLGGSPSGTEKTYKIDEINKLGTLVSQINQMITGVTEGFKKQIKLVGIGYKINYVEPSNSEKLLNSGSLTINIGFSHPITLIIPSSIKVSKEAAKDNKTDQSILELNSTSLTELNNFVYSIKRIRPVDKSFKGTGITIINP